MIEENNRKVYEVTSTNDYLYTKPSDLYEKSTLTIVGKSERKISSYIGGTSLPSTLQEFEVLKVIKGNYDKNKINILYNGGESPLSEYEKSLNTEQLAKRGLDKVEIKKDDVVRYKNLEAPIELNENDEYLIFLVYDESKDLYLLGSNGYSVLKIENNKIYDYNTKSFKETNLLK